MLIKAKFLGSGDPRLTTNNIYTVALPNASPVVIDDNGDLYESGGPLIGTFPWQVVSISIVGQVDLFP